MSIRDYAIKKVVHSYHHLHCSPHPSPYLNLAQCQGHSASVPKQEQT